MFRQWEFPAGGKRNIVRVTPLIFRVVPTPSWIRAAWVDCR